MTAPSVLGALRSRTAAVLLLVVGVLVVVGCASEAGPPARVELVAAPADGEVASWVKEQVGQAGERQVVVYVGASWCEPCRYFHAAIAERRLDRLFPRLTVLEFDLDRDEARLAAAGYTSSMIPLFVRPGPDGRASRHGFQGAIKGEGAVAVIVPRLRALLAR